MSQMVDHIKELHHEDMKHMKEDPFSPCGPGGRLRRPAGVRKRKNERAQ
jgi:hypothetical protein